MSSFDDLNASFTNNLERALQISELNNLVISFAKSAIAGLGRISNPRTGADAVSNQLKAFDNLSQSPGIKEVMPIVHGQQVVLFVSAFESYLKDVTKLICSDYLTQITWPQGASAKIDLAELSQNSMTVGDLVYSIIEQRGVSFQDLQSTIRFFKEYVAITVEVADIYRDNLILAAAIRHSIVHSGGIVDAKFQKQIRNLPARIRNQYKVGAAIEIDEPTVVELRDSFLIFTEILKSALNQRLVSDVS